MSETVCPLEVKVTFVEAEIRVGVIVTGVATVVVLKSRKISSRGLAFQSSPPNKGEKTHVSRRFEGTELREREAGC